MSRMALLSVIAGALLAPPAFAQSQEAPVTPLPAILPTYQDKPYGVVYRLSSVPIGEARSKSPANERLVLPTGQWEYYSDGAQTFRHDYCIRTTRVDGAPSGEGEAAPLDRRSITVIDSNRVIQRDVSGEPGHWEPDHAVRVGADLSILRGAQGESAFPNMTYGKVRTDGVPGWWSLRQMQEMATSTSVEPGERLTRITYQMPNPKHKITISVDQEGIIRQFASAYTPTRGGVLEVVNDFEAVKIIDGCQLPTEIRQVFRNGGEPVYAVTAHVVRFGIGEDAAKVVSPILPEDGEMMEFDEATGESRSRPGRTFAEYAAGN